MATLHRLLLALLPLVAACATKPSGREAGAGEETRAPSRRDESPVPLDPVPAIDFPPTLAAQRQGGAVVLRLFADSAGRLVPESTAVQESSGYPELDSAAVRGIVRIQYAPALRDGLPVATSFLQPITFRASVPRGSS